MIKRSDDAIILQNDTAFMTIGIGAAFMLIMGIRLLVSLPPLKEDYSFGDVFGLIFLCLWIAVIAGMCISALLTYYKKIVINDEGVSCRLPLFKKFLRWSEIKDFGLFYYGYLTRRQGDLFVLYFAEERQKRKNKFRKKLRGPMIKVYITEMEYNYAVETIIPYCEARTSAAPFVAENE